MDRGENNRTKLDDELAALTDALLEGEPVPDEVDVGELEEIVRGLKDLTAPDQPADPAFRKRLETRIDQEWDRIYPQHRSVRFFQRPDVRRFGLVAAVLVVLVGILVILGGDDTASGLQATAEGQISAAVLVTGAMIAAVVVGAVLWYMRRR